MSLFIVEMSVAADGPRSNTSIQAIAQYAESIALAEFQRCHPSSTRFRPLHTKDNVMSLIFCRKVSCGRASVTLWVQHVSACLITTCRTDGAGSISIPLPVQYSIPSHLYENKRDVVVLSCKGQLRPSFSDRTRPSKPLHDM
jgi:hypothetical protein